MENSLFAEIQWLHVLVAAVAYFALGAIWYAALFGGPWRRYQNVNADDPEMKKGAAAIMFGSFILMFVATTGIAVLANLLGIAGLAAGAKLGLLTGVCFAATAISISYLYVKKPAGLHLIDGLYNVTGHIVAAIILAVWQ